MQDPLLLVVLLLGAASALWLLCRALRIPSLLAYILTGAVAGPHALDFLPSKEAGHVAAEVGIVFLMFTIGLKFSLSSLRTIRRHVLGLGTLQVALTGALFAGAALFWLAPREAFLAGAVVAMSSTAVVGRILLENNQTRTPVGGRAMGMLIFQDLAVIPLIIIFSLSGRVDDMLSVAVLAPVKVAAALVVALVVGPRIMPGVYNWLAKWRSNEFFIINIILLIIGVSWITGHLGLSHALGAFLAGILTSETAHRYRVDSIVEPFREVFLGFFFITIGATVHLTQTPLVWLMVLLLAAAVFAVKGALIFSLSKWLGAHTATAVSAALLMGGTGEFGFVLVSVAEVANADFAERLLLINLLAMLITPLLWPFREQIVRRLAAVEWETEAQNLLRVSGGSRGLQQHAVICGFGRTGQAVAGVLNDAGLPYLALEDDHLIVQNAAELDENLVYGSASREECLLAAGIMRARCVVITYVDAAAAQQTAMLARRLRPDMPIYCHCDSLQQGEELRKLGGQISGVVGAHEAAFTLARHALLAAGWGKIRLRSTLHHAREQSSMFLRGHVGGSGDEDDPYAGHLVERVVIGENSAAAGAPPKKAFAEAVVLKRRRGGEETHGEDDSPLMAGDECFLLGTPAVLDNAAKSAEENSA